MKPFLSLLLIPICGLSLAAGDSSADTAKPSNKATKPADDAQAGGKACVVNAQEKDSMIAIGLFDRIARRTAELADTLENIRDKESADAAAGHVQELVQGILSDQSVLGEGIVPSEECVRLYKEHAKKHEKELRQSMFKLLDKLTQLLKAQPPCYGSSSLQEALHNLCSGEERMNGGKK